MTTKAIDFNIGKLLYYSGEPLRLNEDRGITFDWFFMTYTRILDVLGAPKDPMGAIILEEADYKELLNLSSGLVVVRKWDTDPTSPVMEYNPRFIHGIVISIHGYNLYCSCLHKGYSAPEPFPMQYFNFEKTPIN